MIIAKNIVAEFAGTYILIFCGTGAVIIDQVTKGTVTHVGVAVTFGLVVMSLIYAPGDISGAHMNPAVSIAFVFARRFSLKQLLPYIFSQVTGAILASLTLKLLFPSNKLLVATLPAGVSMHFEHLWIYVTAPVVGGVLSIYLWNFLKNKPNYYEYYLPGNYTQRL